MEGVHIWLRWHRSWPSPRQADPSSGDPELFGAFNRGLLGSAHLFPRGHICLVPTKRMLLIYMRSVQTSLTRRLRIKRLCAEIGRGNHEDFARNFRQEVSGRSSRNERLRFIHLRCFPQIVAQRVIQKRPYGGDRGELPDISPRGADCCSQYVGSQQKL